MANNTLLTMNDITYEALRLLEAELTFTKQINRQYQPMFGKKGYKRGETINIRMKPKYSVNEGRVAVISDTVDSSIPLVINKQKNITIEFNSDDLVLSIDDFSNRYLKSMISSLANDLDYEGLLEVKNNVAMSVGQAGAIADTLKLYLSAGAKLDTTGTPRDSDRAVVIGPVTQAGLVDNLKGLFNDVTSISKQYTEGTMGRTAGWKFSMDQNVITHTTGTGIADPIIINGAGQSGDTLTVSGLVGNLKKGDTFTIAGVRELKVKSNQNASFLKQFVVTEDVRAGATEIPIFPAIVFDALNPANNNVSALPANAAELVFVGVPNSDLEIGVAFHKDAITLACVELGKPEGCAQENHSTVSDDELGLSIRFVKDFDTIQDKSIFRVDLLYGWKVVRPEMVCKIVSDISSYNLEDR